MPENLVELRGIHKEFGDTIAVHNVDMTIKQGEFVVLLGPSGSGKTTILSIIGGFVTPTSGAVAIEGEDVTLTPPAKRPTVTVFQDYALFPHMSVASNVGFGLAMRGVGKSDKAQKVDEALRLVGLEGYGQRGVHELSGGQRQRVALARAIAVEPSVLLLDEPLGALDLNLRRQMQEELVGLQKQLGTTFVHVTHDQDEAMSIADTIVVINHGRIEDIGPPERVYRKPATRFTATFMGESNVLDGRVENGNQIRTCLGALPMSAGMPTAKDVHVSIRPECIRIGAANGNAIDIGKVHITERMFQGTHVRMRGRIPDAPDRQILIRTGADAAVDAGTDVPVHVLEDDIVILAD